MDPDADLECHTEPLLQLRPGVAQRHDEIEAGEHCSPGVVLVRRRVAEAGQDAVAGVLHQVAVVLLHGFPGGRAVGAEQVPQLLGLHPLGQQGGADQVGEEQRHEGPLPGRAELTGHHLAQEEAGLSPVATSRLATEVWEVVREHDWVLTAGTASGWAPKIWDFEREYRHPGASLGTATQIGISLGVALAHKGSGKLVVDLQPDGDLMFDLGALWIAAYHRIPMLAVMFNNRAYYNDWEHQERIARARGTDVTRAYIGMEIDKPAPDFAAAARAMGWFGEGPIDDPEQVRAAVRRAADVVMSEGRPALVDVVCQYD